MNLHALSGKKWWALIISLYLGCSAAGFLGLAAAFFLGDLAGALAGAAASDIVEKLLLRSERLH